MITLAEAKQNYREAQRTGATRYLGRPCKRGHTAWRFTRGQGCAECRPEPKKRSQRESREAAIACGENIFEGDPCPNGHTTRYVKGNSCVACMKNRPKADRAAEAKAYYASLSPEQHLLNGARERARKKGRLFTISVTDITVPTHCPVLGIPLERREGRVHDNSPSLDRIDNSKGYVPGNVLVISWRANRLKGDGLLWELKALAAYVEDHTNSK